MRQILQVPRVATSTQFAGQQQIVQAAQQKPLTKYAKQKLRKEQKKQEEEERIRKLQEDDRLRRQQQLSGNPVVSGHPPASQSAQPISMPSLSGPQPHPKLLEAKQQGGQVIPAVKQEPQLDQNAGGAQRVAVQTNAQGQDGQSGQVVNFHLHMTSSICLCGICRFFIPSHTTRLILLFLLCFCVFLSYVMKRGSQFLHSQSSLYQVGNKNPGQSQLIDTGSQAIATAPIDPSIQSLSGEQSHLGPSQAGSALPRYPNVANPPYPVASVTPASQGAGAVRQVHSFL